METQEVITMNDPSKLMADNEATAPANTFKSRVLPQGSHRLKAAPAQPSLFPSAAAVSSNLYPWTTENQGLTVPEKDKKILNEKDLESETKCKEGSGNEIVGDSRLMIAGDVSSPSGSKGIEDSFAETAHANREFSAKRLRLDPTILDGAVAQSGETLHDHGLITDTTFQDSETNMLETTNPGLNLGRCGTQSITKEELEKKREMTLEEKKERIKKSKRESALRVKLRKKEEIQKLQEMVEMLQREYSKLTKKLLQISVECEKVNEENESLMDEVEEMHGPDAILDIRARNPASANQKSNDDKEGTSSDANLTDDQNREMPQ